MCYKCSVCMYAWFPQAQKKVLGPLGLELQVIVSHHVGAGN